MSVRERKENSANFEAVSAKLQAAAVDAVTTLHAGLFEGPPSTRIRAALAIVSLATTSMEITDLECRLNTLERSRRK